MQIACVLAPRFALRVACARQPELLTGAVALAPLPGTKQAIGEVSSTAEASGLRPGMPLGEALSRCPSLCLTPADPARVAELWDALVGRLEGIGAAVESERPGEAFFEVDGLRGIHGGDVAGVIAAARGAAHIQVQIAVAPNRFAAYLAARRGSQLPRGPSESNGEAVIPSRALCKFLSPFPVATLSARLGTNEREASNLIVALKRLGLGTLGKLAALHPDQIADRFGSLGLRALRLARGELIAAARVDIQPNPCHRGVHGRTLLRLGSAGVRLRPDNPPTKREGPASIGRWDGPGG